MPTLLRPTTFAALVSASMLAVTPQQAKAQDYPIDCAILLCLSGGWPASAPCTAARAEFIRRITPWPVEPPLQIWRCPLGGAVGGSSPAALLASPSDIPGSEPTPPADIDISGPAFDPIRSIRVYHVQYTQRTTGGGGMGEECQRSDGSRIGTYGPQGEYVWQEWPATLVPTGLGFSAFDPPANCRPYQYRSVAVSWTDILGNTGLEEVRY